jgi:hypothetical protein
MAPAFMPGTTTQAEQLAAAQAGGDLGEKMVAVEAWTGGQELGELFGAVGPGPDPTEMTSGSTGRLGGLTLATGLKGIKRLSVAACRIRFRSERQAMVRL